MSYVRSGAIVLLLVVGPARAADLTYQIDLGPTARIEATRLTTLGRGTAQVTLDGNKLTINGQFGGMASRATDAHLCVGEGIGTPGTCDGGDLTVTKDTSGILSGMVALNSKLVSRTTGRSALCSDQQRRSPGSCGQFVGLDPLRP